MNTIKSERRNNTARLLTILKREVKAACVSLKFANEHLILRMFVNFFKTPITHKKNVFIWITILF